MVVFRRFAIPGQEYDNKDITADEHKILRLWQI